MKHESPIQYSEEFLDRHFEIMCKLLDLREEFLDLNWQRIFRVVFSSQEEDKMHFLQRTFILCLYNLALVTTSVCKKNDLTILVKTNDLGLFSYLMSTKYPSNYGSIYQILNSPIKSRYYDGMNFEEMSRDWRYKSIYSKTTCVLPDGNSFFTERFSDKIEIEIFKHFDLIVVHGAPDEFELIRGKFHLVEKSNYIFSCYNRGESYRKNFNSENFEQLIGIKGYKFQKTFKVDGSDQLILGYGPNFPT